MKRRLTGATGAAALGLLVLTLGPARASGTAGTPAVGTLSGVTPVAISTAPGDQTDPHVAGRYVSYTSEVSGNSEVRVHNLATGSDTGVPQPGGLDFLSDTDGTTVTYTHLGADSSIWTYDPATGNQAEIAPTPGANRRESRVGGDTIVWQDFAYTNDFAQAEIVVESTATGAVTRLTDDHLLDKDPAVSPDGNTVVWTKCQTDGTGCVVWEAQRSGSGWSTAPLTSAGEGEAGLPDTDGKIVVYSVVANGDEDIRWQPVGGGAEHELTLPGQQTNPNVSNGVVTYEQLDTTTQVPNYDVWLWDIAANTRYRLTDTPEDETLNDVSVSPERQVTVVWTKSELDDNVYGVWFTLPPLPSADTTPPTVAVEGFDDGQLVLLGAPRPTASCSSSDAGSGIAATTGPVEQDDLTANGVGTVSVTCTATDRAGNTASATSSYRIGYAFGGFLAPAGGAVTRGHAGRTVPVKWQLTDASGGFVDALSAVASIGYRPCGSTALETAAGGLRYDTTADQYVFTWKTPRTAGCYVLSLLLDSGQQLNASFRLS